MRGCAFEEHFARKDCGSPQFLAVHRRGHTAERTHIPGHTVRFAELDVSSLERDRKFLGNYLREACADVLAILDLAGPRHYHAIAFDDDALLQTIGRALPPTIRNSCAHCAALFTARIARR